MEDSLSIVPQTINTPTPSSEANSNTTSAPVEAPVEKEQNTEVSASKQQQNEAVSAPIKGTIEKVQTKIGVIEQYFPDEEVVAVAPKKKVVKDVLQKDTVKKILPKEAVKDTVKDTAALVLQPKDTLAVDTVPIINFEAEVKRDVSTIPSISGIPRVQTASSSVWFTPFLLLLLMAYVSVFSIRYKAFKTEVLTFFNPKAGGSIFGVEWQRNSMYKIILASLGVINLALFAYFYAVGRNWEGFKSFHIILCILFTALIVYGKKKLIDLLQYVYFPERDTNYSDTYMCIVRLLGVCLLPAIAVYTYAPASYTYGSEIFGIIVLILAKVFIFGKVIRNFFSGLTSTFYLFLYLCTLEILPTFCIGIFAHEIVMNF